MWTSVDRVLGVLDLEMEKFSNRRPVCISRSSTTKVLAKTTSKRNTYAEVKCFRSVGPAVERPTCWVGGSAVQRSNLGGLFALVVENTTSALATRLAEDAKFACSLLEVLDSWSLGFSFGGLGGTTRRVLAPGARYATAA